jgi:hypothetical protein
MRPGGGSARDDNAAIPPYSLAALRHLKRGWALIRWAGLILAVGLGAAFLIAIAVGALATLLDSSL